MNEPKRRLKIDMQELVDAYDFRDDSDTLTYWFDLETGDVVLVHEEARSMLEDIYRKYADPDTGELDWQVVLPQLNVQGWEQDTILVANRIEQGLDTRFIAIPDVHTFDGYKDMVRFIGTVSNQRLQERLDWAIRGKGAFRRFKDVLYDYPDWRERWFQFRDERMYKRVLYWLETIGVEPMEDTDE